jgi:predicted RNA-binding protein
MCQATVYLNGREVMRDVLRVEPTPEGIRLYAFFEEPRVVPAAIQEIDLIKHRVMLVSDEEADSDE